MSVDTKEQEITKAERRRIIVKRRLDTLIHSQPQLYYEATSAVARAVHDDINEDDTLDELEKSAIAQLSVRDVEIILAYR